ncbi:MAG: spore germination protein [Oscillospiraceae bacterium]|jgi:spore germination protein KA|nr:spore germination protein [Oscillospiraceae bacterium]
MGDEIKNNSPEYFGAELESNIEIVRSMFKNDDTVVFRQVTNLYRSDFKCYVIFADGMTDNIAINNNVVRPLTTTQLPAARLSEELISNIVTCGEIAAETLVEKVIRGILKGDTVLFTQGIPGALLLNTKGGSVRSVTEPQTEKNLMGPRDGFTEQMTVNISLLRRRIQTSDLKFELQNIGLRTNTRVCVIYLESIVNKNILEELKRRLEKIDIDAVLDSNYLDECIKDHPYSPFKTIGRTEKPDIAAAKILEGRVVILVDGTPIALTVPYLFVENFQSNDDYYINYIFSTIIRFLRVLGCFLTIVLPAVYIALVNFHHEMIPGLLLINVAKSTANIPLTSVMEVAIMLILFELLRETGVRMPSAVGQALSIVGALVFGQAAISAGIVSNIIVIVMALTGTTTLLVPRMNGAVIVCRILLIIFAGIIGLFGVYFGFMLIFIHLLSIESFGVFYLTGFGASTVQRTKDIFVRLPMWMQKDRPPFVRRDKRRRSNVER